MTGIGTTPSHKERAQKVYAHWRPIVQHVRNEWAEEAPTHGVPQDVVLMVFAAHVRAEIMADASRGGLNWAGIKHGFQLIGLKVVADIVRDNLQVHYDITRTPLSATPQDWSGLAS